MTLSEATRHRIIPYAYGAIHALVDASTVCTVFGAVALADIEPGDAFAFILGYDLLAFASQVVWGPLVDRFRLSRVVTLIGLVTTALGLLVTGVDPTLAMAVAGIGNALFHVGAGAAALSVDPGRASAPGIFVGPGALGLAVGLFLGRTGEVPVLPFTIGLALAAGAVALLGNVRPPEALPRPRPAAAAAGVIAVLLLVSIAVRAFVGMAGCHACPKLDWLPWAMATAACLGKASGGVIADRIGWKLASVGALVVSAPLIAFGSGTPLAMVVGMFLFQMTMPVTLVALHILWPRFPGFAFGLACVALVAGALLTSVPAAHALYSELPFLLLILGSAAALWGALHRLGVPSALPRTSDRLT